MKIYTRTGDKGMTSLVGGKRISKADLRLDTYGTADELNAFVGLLRAQKLTESDDTILQIIQNKLFNVGAYLASEVENEKMGNMIGEEDVRFLEDKIDAYTNTLPPMRGFVLPAGNEKVSLAHVCRTITRRLERKMVALYEQSGAGEEVYLQYVNRLSDFLFVLARKLTYEAGETEILWEK